MLNHELQVIVTVTLLAITSVLALLSDFVRIRAMRRAMYGRSRPQEPQVTVPEVPAQVVSTGRSSRLAVALKQPRRELSAGAKAAIERGSMLATPERRPAASAEPVRPLQHVG